MSIAKRSFAMIVGMGLVVALATLPIRAQDPATKKGDDPKAEATAKKKFDPARRVPDYFGQIGLTAEQRESIYKIRKGHQEKVDALRKEIAEIEAKSLQECEAKLTETQKKLLDHLRSTGARGQRAPEPATKK
jgi:hypothetical protein